MMMTSAKSLIFKTPFRGCVCQISALMDGLEHHGA